MKAEDKKFESHFEAYIDKEQIKFPTSGFKSKEELHDFAAWFMLAIKSLLDPQSAFSAK